MESPRQRDERFRLYRLLAIGQKQLGWDDEFYRDVFLVKHGATEKGGRISASTLDLPGLEAALADMMRCGFVPKAKRGSVAAVSDWRKPRIKKITAVWCALADAGVVRNRTEAAMVKWCARITGKAKLQWARPDDLNNCIEALKGWALREGVELDD